MVESELESFSAVKRAQNKKTEGGIKRKKTWKCEAEGRRAWGDFTSRKTRRTHRETASENSG